jgi:hypothetical protein
MAIKVKEIKSDAKINITVNRNFYMMSKALSFYLFQEIGKKQNDEYFKEIMTKSYADLDDLQRSFYTVALLLAEIESQAKDSDQLDEKEVLEPGDPDYKAPSLD